MVPHLCLVPAMPDINQSREDCPNFSIKKSENLNKKNIDNRQKNTYTENVIRKRIQTTEEVTK